MLSATLKRWNWRQEVFAVHQHEQWVNWQQHPVQWTQMNWFDGEKRDNQERNYAHKKKEGKKKRCFSYHTTSTAEMSPCFHNPHTAAVLQMYSGALFFSTAWKKTPVVWLASHSGPLWLSGWIMMLTFLRVRLMKYCSGYVSVIDVWVFGNPQMFLAETFPWISQ